MRKITIDLSLAGVLILGITFFVGPIATLFNTHLSFRWFDIILFFLPQMVFGLLGDFIARTRPRLGGGLQIGLSVIMLFLFIFGVYQFITADGGGSTFIFLGIAYLGGIGISGFLFFMASLISVLNPAAMKESKSTKSSEVLYNWSSLEQ